MKKLLVLLPLLFLLPYQTDAAVALDTSGEITALNNSGAAYTVTGANPTLVAYCRTDDSGDNLTTVKYNTVAMTQVQKTNYTGSQWIYGYVLYNPSTGSNTFAITNVAGHSFDCAIESFTGTDPTQPDASRVSSFTGTALSQAITVVTTGSWVSLFWDNTITCTNTVSATTNLTVRVTAGCAHALGDSAASASAGSYTQSGTMGSSQTWGIIQIAVRAPAAAATSDDDDGADFWP